MRILSLLVFCTIPAFAADTLLPVPVGNATVERWLKKPVLESRLLDDMESPATWTSGGEAEITFSTERARDGGHSLRLQSKTKSDKPGRSLGRPFGYAAAVRHFSGEDWSSFNRISFWVYPDLPGFYHAGILVRLHNEGRERVPDVYNREGFNYLMLNNRQWNHVVWEVAHLARDKVTALDLQYALEGNEPEAADVVQFDFDQLELQRVKPDQYEGWNVASGRISYSQVGYAPDAAKVALASGLGAREFRVIDRKTGKVVLKKAVAVAKGPLAGLQAMDFSEIHRPSTYILQAGDVATRPFKIGRDVWTGTVWKALNFFYAERCGMEIPGVHRVCHRDWQGVHGNRRMIINGGWHDAGDLSQGLVNTSEAVYAMLDLAERLRARGLQPELQRRLVAEAKWGLDWVLKTSFGDGYRITWATMGFWTNGILGDADDVSFQAANMPFENFEAAAAEALAARVLKTNDPDRAAYGLKRAREDWQFAVDGVRSPAPLPTGAGAPGGPRGLPIEIASAGLLASVNLYRSTGEKRFADKAVEFAGVIYDSQQRTPLATTPPLSGFFYTGPTRDRILHYGHRGHEQAPIVALAELCQALARHPDRGKWESVLRLHAGYLKTTSQFTEPYGMLPASIYTENEFESAPENRRDAFREQVLNGLALGGGYRLRTYPVWFDYRGNYGVMLSQAKALSTEARLLNDKGLNAIVQRQLEWVVGRNPFAQSTMFGVGYDFAPQYSEMSGDIVGSLPVGMETRANFDAPYWPPQNCYTYKEVWVHPVSRWMWIIADLVDIEM